jgi:hypothetical protein
MRLTLVSHGLAATQLTHVLYILYRAGPAKVALRHDALGRVVERVEGLISSSRRKESAMAATDMAASYQAAWLRVPIRPGRGELASQPVGALTMFNMPASRRLRLARHVTCALLGRLRKRARPRGVTVQKVDEVIRRPKQW